MTRVSSGGRRPQRRRRSEAAKQPQRFDSEQGSGTPPSNPCRGPYNLKHLQGPGAALTRIGGGGRDSLPGACGATRGSRSGLSSRCGQVACQWSSLARARPRPFTSRRDLWSRRSGSLGRSASGGPGGRRRPTVFSVTREPDSDHIPVTNVIRA